MTPTWRNTRHPWNRTSTRYGWAGPDDLLIGIAAHPQAGLRWSRSGKTAWSGWVRSDARPAIREDEAARLVFEAFPDPRAYADRALQMDWRLFPRSATGFEATTETRPWRRGGGDLTPEALLGRVGHVLIRDALPAAGVFAAPPVPLDGAKLLEEELSIMGVELDPCIHRALLAAIRDSIQEAASRSAVLLTDTYADRVLWRPTRKDGQVVSSAGAFVRIEREQPGLELFVRDTTQGATWLITTERPVSAFDERLDAFVEIAKLAARAVATRRLQYEESTIRRMLEKPKEEPNEVTR